MTTLWLVYSTFPGKAEAISAARTLVEKRLVACANVLDQVTSVYRWEDAVQQETEAVLIAKTSEEKLSDAIDAVRRAHSYDLPCITAWPIAGGFPPFLQWVAQETK